MKHLLAPLLCALAVLTALPVHATDFQSGMAAARSGDFKGALAAWTPLAEKGDALAQYYVGLLHQNGQGVAQDHGTAVSWYERAAAQGLAQAQYGLAVMFDNGFGVQQSYAKALAWYTRAAIQGDADALYTIGKYHAKGLGVERNPIHAFAWWNAAAKAGHKKAGNRRDKLAETLSAAELTAAQKLTVPE